MKAVLPCHRFKRGSLSQDDVGNIAQNVRDREGWEEGRMERRKGSRLGVPLG